MRNNTERNERNVPPFILSGLAMEEEARKSVHWIKCTTIQTRCIESYNSCYFVINEGDTLPSGMYDALCTHAFMFYEYVKDLQRTKECMSTYIHFLPVMQKAFVAMLVARDYKKAILSATQVKPWAKITLMDPFYTPYYARIPPFVPPQVHSLLECVQPERGDDDEEEKETAPIIAHAESRASPVSNRSTGRRVGRPKGSKIGRNGKLILPQSVPVADHTIRISTHQQRPAADNESSTETYHSQDGSYAPDTHMAHDADRDLLCYEQSPRIVQQPAEDTDASLMMPVRRPMSPPPQIRHDTMPPPAIAFPSVLLREEAIRMRAHQLETMQRFQRQSIVRPIPWRPRPLVFPPPTSALFAACAKRFKEEQFARIAASEAVIADAHAKIYARQQMQLAELDAVLTPENDATYVEKTLDLGLTDTWTKNYEAWHRFRRQLRDSIAAKDYKVLDDGTVLSLK